MSSAPAALPMAPHWRRSVVGLLLAAVAALAARAESVAAPPARGLDAQAAVRDSQAAIGRQIGRQIGDHRLLNRDGRPVRLSDFRGKPLLVSFIYTGCFQVCPGNTRALQKAVRALETRFGNAQFNVVSIGFNQPADSPMAMKSFAAQYGIDFPQWSFLSPNAADVAALTGEFGFRYQATPAGFDHVLQVTLVDAQGRIVRQVYGDEVPADALGEPLTQLLANSPVTQPSNLAALIDRVRVLCTVYDPTTGRYRVDYGLALEIAGGLTFAITMLIFFFNEWRGRRAARRTAQA